MPESDQYWQGFLFSNSKYRLSNVTLNGEALQRQENNFWTHDGELSKPPYQLTLTTYGGATLSAIVQRAMRRNDLKVQFDAWSMDGLDEPSGADYVRDFLRSRGEVSEREKARGDDGKKGDDSSSGGGSDSSGVGGTSNNDGGGDTSSSGGDDNNSHSGGDGVNQDNSQEEMHESTDA